MGTLGVLGAVAVLAGLGIGGSAACTEAPAASGSSGTLVPHRREPGPDGVRRDEFGIPIDQPVPREARERIGEFLAVMVRPPLDETSDLHDQWLHRWKAELARLLAEGGEDLGNAALHAYCGEVSDYTVTRRNLLMIGAACSPEAATPLLRELTLNYGYRYDDRTEAALLYAQTSPEGYLKDLTPFLQRRERPSVTMPPDEFLLAGYLEATRRLGRSPVTVCADVATNLHMEPAARYQAAKALGDHPDDPIARHALETCLIESTGDGYLRRMAAQAIERAYPGEDACSLLRDVLSKEADPSFAGFLLDMVTRLGCR